MSELPIIDYEGSDYQERFWDRGDRAYEDQAEAVALRRLLPPAAGRLLELGAGAGRNSPRYGGFEGVVLLDYSRSQLRQARARLGGGRFAYVVGDAYRLPFAGGVFAGATMIRTLHHLVKPEVAIGEVRRVVRSGAPFILEFANKRNLKAIGRWVLGRQTWSPFGREPVEFVPLNFDFHPAAVRSWLHAAGFEVGRQLAVSHFRVRFLKRLVPTRILVAADALLQWTGNWFPWTPSVFVKAIAEGEA